MLFIQGAQNLNRCRPVIPLMSWQAKETYTKWGCHSGKKKNLSINVPSQVMTNSLVFFVGNRAWPKNSKGMFLPPSLGARGKGRSPGRDTGISIFKYATIVSDFETRHNFDNNKKKNRKLEKVEKEND